MARRTLEIFECDICGEEGERFTIQFPDGSLALDRCTIHARPLYDLKEGPGQWTASGSGRVPFHVSSVEDIVKQREPPK